MPDIHWFTAGSGGIGKTLLATSVAVNKIASGGELLVVDLNFNNPDISKALMPIIRDQNAKELSLDDLGFLWTRVRGNGKYHYIVYPPATGRGLSLPEGVFGLHRRLNDIIAALQKEGATRPRFDPSECIVDTGLNVYNIFPFDTEPSDNDPEFSALEKYQFKLWFIWTLALVKSSSDIQTAVASLEWARKKGWLALPMDLVHVLNPANLVDTSVWGAFMPRYEIKIAGFEKLLNDHPDTPIDFYTFAHEAWKAIHNNVGGDLQNQLEEIAKQIRFRGQPSKEGIGKFFPKSREGFRPRNLFPIPYHDRSLVDYLANVNMPDRRFAYNDFDGLARRLGKVYTATRSFLTEYR